MSWSNIQLSGVFAKINADAQARAAKLMESLTEMQAIKSAVQSVITAKETEVDNLKNLLSELKESGFYFIALSALQGSWSKRLQNADNAPNNSATLYSAAVVSLAIAPSPGPVNSAFNALRDAMQKPLENPFAAPEMPQFSAPEKTGQEIDFDTNAWQSKTICDIMPGQFATAENELNAEQLILDQANNTMRGIEKKEAALQNAFAEAQNMASRLSNTGVYNLLLPPAIGGWLDRMKAESNVPVDSDLDYSGGTITVIIGGSMLEVQSKYSKLVGVLS